jgi:hypothetical protein
MQTNTGINSWAKYVETETSFFLPKLESLGFEIDENQIHTKGERYAFRAQKLILTGIRKSDNLKVVIKVTREKEGREEILHERDCRLALHKIDFAYHEFLDPEEIYFETSNNFTILVTEFIEEDKKFLDRDSKEQFQIALISFVTQEGIHAVTTKHNKFINKYFETYNFKKYVSELENNKNKLLEIFPNLKNAIEAGEDEFKKNEYRVSQYCGFLTHTDFVPHNFRVREGRVYLLDHSAIRIGNKHEGWGRFLNFMVLHNPLLYNWFVKYFDDNRSVEELESLRLMRIYRLFELINHHANIFKNGEMGSELKKLSETRVYFWLELLKAVVENRELESNIIEEYKNCRDQLRTNEEKERQKVLY